MPAGTLSGGVGSEAYDLFCRAYPQNPQCAPGTAGVNLLPPAPCAPGHQGACIGGKVVEGTGTEGLDPFTQIIIGATGNGIGGILGGVVGSGIGKVVAETVVGGGDVAGLIGTIVPGAAGGFVGTIAQEEFGYRPDYLSPTQQGVLGPGGIGGGALTAAPYLQTTGRLAGALLSRKKVNIKQLVTGGSGAILSSLLRSIF